MPEDQHIHGVGRDLSRRHHQAAIQVQLGSATGVGTWSLSPRTGQLTLSPLTRALRGLGDEAGLSVADGLKRYRGGAHRQLSAAFTALTERGVPFDVEVPLTAADGAARRIRIAGQDDPAGSEVHGTLEDVTTAHLDLLRLRGFEELVTRSPEGVVELHTDGTVRYANECLARMLDVEAAALAGRPVTELLADPGRDPDHGWLETLVADPDAVVRGETALRRADGSRCGVHATASALVAEDGSTRGVVVVATQRPRHETDGARHARQLAVSRDGWWELDRTTDTVHVSARLRELLDLPDEDQDIDGEVELTRLLGLPPLPHAAQDPGQRPPAQAGGTTRDELVVVERLLPHSDGTRLPVEIRFLVERDEAGHAVRISGAVSDLSAVQRNRIAAEQLVAGVSHELRAPLTAISGAIATLARSFGDELPGTARDLVALAQRNVNRLRERIDDLLAPVAADSDRPPLRPEPVALLALVERCLADNAPLAADHGVTFQLGHADEAWVTGEPRRLDQALTNLLSNAVRYAPEASHVTVDVQLVAPDDPTRPTVRVGVTDHGPGIPEGFRDRLFDPYAQADRPNPGGAGLGLAIVKDLITRHGGRVGADSEPGHTTVWFELPLGSDPDRT